MALGPLHNAAAPVSILRLDHTPGGYLHGLTQPFLKARLQFHPPSRMDWTNIDEALQAIAADDGPAYTAPSDEPVASAAGRILHFTAALQRGALDPVFEAGRVLTHEGGLVVLALPTTDHTIAVQALKVVVDLIHRGQGRAAAASELVLAARPDLERLADMRRRQGPGAADMVKFLEAAHLRRMPWIRVGNTSTFQIGHGARARWLDGSFTEATSVIGVKLAGNKLATATVLRQAGVPAPPHIVVQNEDAAEAAAKALGYPVVVKPSDLDRGLGVFVRLKNAGAVRKAFTEARKLSPNILVERFVEGRDYRMVVLNGRLIWAIERVPGSVTGDGERTVRQLVDQLNADPRRSGRDGTALKPLRFDQEAIDLLAERNLDGESVPPKGEWVRLRGASNVASGGVPVAVFDQVHPDNKRLAERAARALHLDLAGVDLIAPDIGRSWKETGAGVCEVNAQPAFGTTVSAHLYGEILDNLIQSDGRIPIGLVIGAPAASQACVLAARIVAAAGPRVGIAAPDGVWIGPDHIHPGLIDVFSGARLLIGDGDTQAAIVAVSDAGAAATGLPFDRCTVVALAGARLAEPADGGAAFDALARALLPLSQGPVVINAGDAACLALATHIRGGRMILYAAAAGLPAVLEHRANGGGAVWVEDAAEGRRLILADGAEDPVRIALNENHSAEDIALAASLAWALGCGEVHLRQGLA